MKHEDEFRQLAEGLHNVPPTKLRMGIWGYGRLDVESDNFECNFAGCAMGWMPKLVPQNTLVGAGGIPTFYASDDERRTLHSPATRVGFGAIALYFDISYADARYLFGTDYQEYPITPIVVAARMMDFLDSKNEVNP